MKSLILCTLLIGSYVSTAQTEEANTEEENTATDNNQAMVTCLGKWFTTLHEQKGTPDDREGLLRRCIAESSFSPRIKNSTPITVPIMESSEKNKETNTEEKNAVKDGNRAMANCLGQWFALFKRDKGTPDNREGLLRLCIAESLLSRRIKNNKSAAVPITESREENRESLS